MNYIIPFLCCLGQILAQETADTLFFNGDILTVDDKNPQVEAVAVKNGTIIFAGDRQQAFSLKGEKTELVDLKGMTLLPGFIDPHTHVFLRAVIDASTDVSPFKYKTIDEVLSVLKEALKKGPVLAFGYDPSLMTKPGELDFKTLDTLSKDIPIVVVNKSGHIAYGNHKAFELAHISEDIKNPAGGSYGRDAKGELNGTAYEVPAVSRLISAVNKINPDEFEALGKKTMQDYAKWGYTTVTDLGLGLPLPTPEDHIKMMRSLSLDIDAPLRMQGYVIYDLLSNVPGLQKQNTDRFKVLGVKIWADGSIQGYTAALKEPYSDKDTKGVLNFKQNTLTQMISNVRKNNIQVAVHANGDQAIEDTLSAMEAAQKAYPSEDPRFRLEHATLVEPGQWQRVKKLNATPSFTEHHVYYWGEVFKDKILGDVRAEWIDAAKTAKDLGLKYSFNDDDLAGANPLLFIQVAATREMRDGQILNPEQRITVDDAIKGLTIYPAWQSFREKEIGSIEVGKLADFVILEKNPKRVPANTVKDIKIVETWLGGKKVR